MATSTKKQPKKNWWQKRTGAQQTTLVCALIAALGGIVVAIIGLYGVLTGNANPPESQPTLTPTSGPALSSRASIGTPTLPVPRSTVRVAQYNASNAPTPSPTPSSRASIGPTPGPAPSSRASVGTLTLPAPGSTVRADKQLHASGTATIPAGHKLELFLEFGREAKYWAAGNPRTAVPLANGKWHGTIYVGGASGITIWLVDLPPASITLLNEEVNYQNNGFPSISNLGKVLASVQYTASYAPTPSPTPSSRASVGTLTLPAPGSTVRADKQLHASGTATIPAGHKLELFLEFGSEAKYWAAGNPRTAVPLANGKWHGTIYVGGASGITIWLVDLPPASVTLVNKEVNYQNNGFPSISTLGKVLASVQYTAK